MKDEKFDLSTLRIASPCPASWQNMQGDDRKRFCSSCELNVYNVAGMSEAEVRSLIGSSGGRLCMRLRRRMDGTVITKDCPVGLRAVRKRVSMFASATMSTVLGLFSVSFGQKAEEAIPTVPGITISRILSGQQKSIISGKVVDPNGAAVYDATIRLLDSSTRKETLVAQTDKRGEFRLEVAAGKYIIQIYGPGWAILEIASLEIAKGEDISLNVELHLEAFMGIIQLPIFPMIDMKTPGPTTRKLTREDLDRIPGGRPF